jgi:hypothetical protein
MLTKENQNLKQNDCHNCNIKLNKHKNFLDYTIVIVPICITLWAIIDQFFI